MNYEHERGFFVNCNWQVYYLYREEKGEDDPATKAILSNTALALAEIGNVNEGESIIDTIDISVFPKLDYETIYKIEFNRGEIKYISGKYEESKEAYQKAYNSN